MFKIYSETGYFGEEFTTSAEAESRIDELEIDFGKNTFWVENV